MSRTINFTFSIVMGTNPYFLIDYNDSSPVAKPNAGVLDQNYTFIHTFPNSGYYDVNITVFNLVSLVSKIVRVSIMSLLQRFWFSPFTANLLSLQ